MSPYMYPYASNNYSPYPSSYQNFVRSPGIPQQSFSNIIWVSGRTGAKAHQLPPSSSAILLDSEASKFYIKSTDNTGMPTMDGYSFKKDPPIESEDKEQEEDLFKKINDRIDSLASTVNEIKKSIYVEKEQVQNVYTQPNTPIINPAPAQYYSQQQQSQPIGTVQQLPQELQGQPGR